MARKGAWKRGGAGPERLGGRPRPLRADSPEPLPEGPREARAGRWLGSRRSAGAPGLTCALAAGSTRRPEEAPRPSTRFLPGAGPGGHKPSAVKFKEVRETLRRNLSGAGK